MANWAINSESVGSENALIKSDKLKLPKTIKEIIASYFFENGTRKFRFCKPPQSNILKPFLIRKWTKRL
jgi:hypothetical protein